MKNTKGDRDHWGSQGPPEKIDVGHWDSVNGLPKQVYSIVENGANKFNEAMFLDGIKHVPHEEAKDKVMDAISEFLIKTANNENIHYSKLEQMYLAAPINLFYNPTISITEGKCEIAIDVKPDYFHAANAVHGSVYFKMLDDAAFFAANSIVEDVFVLTGSFETKFLRPISEGELIAKGELLKNLGNKLEARAKLYDQGGKLIATGSGWFIKSKINLEEIPSFKI